MENCREFLKRMALGSAAVLTAVTAFAHNFGDETVAFFPFDDGAVGSSAKDVTLKNAIAGYSSLTGRVSGAVMFSDEAPGKYLFTNLAYTTGAPVYTNPKSLYISGSDGKVYFDDLMKTAKALGAYKVELWCKFDTGSKDDTGGFVSMYGGWQRMSGSTVLGTNGCLNIQFREIEGEWATRWVDQRISGGSKDNIFGRWDQPEYSSSSSLIDGKWHHVTFALPMGSADDSCCVGAGGLQAAICNSLSNANIQFADNPDDPGRLLVVNAGGKFRGWISCVRLSKMPGRVATTVEQDWLHPSTLATCAPRAFLRYRFEDGVAGQAFGSGIVTNMSSYNLSNPDIYTLPNSYTFSGSGYSAGRVWGNGEMTTYLTDPSGEELVEPTAEADVKKAKVLATKDDTKGQDNALSAKFVSPTLSDSSTYKYTFGYGLLSRVDTYLQPLPTDPQTIEFFFKFDYEDWKARTSIAVSKRVSLMWMSPDASLIAGTGALATFGVELNLSDEATPKICIVDWDQHRSEAVSDKIIDGKWHHVAVTIVPSTAKWKATASLYLDYEHMLTYENMSYANQESDGGFPGGYVNKAATGRNIWFARAIAKYYSGGVQSWNNAFNGKIDEIRLSNGVLEPSEFLRQKNMEGLIWTLR